MNQNRNRDSIFKHCTKINLFCICEIKFRILWKCSNEFHGNGKAAKSL